jgi:hypothetical protein
MDLEETEARNDYAGEGSSNLAVSQSFVSCYWAVEVREKSTLLAAAT